MSELQVETRRLGDLEGLEGLLRGASIEMLPLVD